MTSRPLSVHLRRTQAGQLQPAGGEEEMPRAHLTARRTLLFLAFTLVAIGVLYFVLPNVVGGFHKTWQRLGEGNEWWLGVALVVELASMASYIAIFQGVHVPPGSPITYRESYQITMASLAATRLFAAGGAGGVALTAWALRRSGMPRREVAQRMIAFLVLLYGVYMVAMAVCGFGLYAHLFPGRAPFGVTVVPAIVAALAIVVFAAIALVPEDLERRLSDADRARHARLARLVRRLAAGAASISGGVRFAIYKLRHPDWALTGTIAWWAGNVAILWACFKAFGEPPPLAVLVQGYFVGLLGNLLPLPGGIGGVDGGLIGAFVAFGVSGSLAVVAVLAYRFFAFWLPSVPGAIAYFQLRRTVARWREAGRAVGPLDVRPAPA